MVKETMYKKIIFLAIMNVQLNLQSVSFEVTEIVLEASSHIVR